VREVYKRAYRGWGALTPPLEYYRNMDRNWELTAPIADRTIDVPCLMISGADDVVLRPEMTEGMEERVPNLEKIVIENCGHWTQQEHPRETNEAMLRYLRRLPA
jgi:pimeloyl-ACP methyl ester carboxylesterase